MVSAGSYLLGAATLAAVVLCVGFSAVRLRQRTLGEWEGAPARLVESILAIAIVIWIVELLGSFDLFYATTLVGACVGLAATVAWKVHPRAGAVSQGGGPGGGSGPRPHARTERSGAQAAMSWIALGVVAVVFAHWGLSAKQALERGISNFDSLWYHMPFAVDMVQSHSVTGLHYTDTVFTNWFYPQNSELLHAVGILLTHRDTLSPFINLGWLAIAFLAAWCIGRPYGRGALTVIAAAIVLDCHTLVVREPGAAKNDLAAAALLLAAIAILINAWALRRNGETAPAKARGSLAPGWPLAVAGLASGLAVGTRDTALAMAAALSVAVLVLAAAGKRRAAAGWWFLPAVLGGGFWYLRNLIVASNPLPEIAHIGPISLPHPDEVQSARPGYAISHYATDATVWREYFFPGLHQAFGPLWPAVIGAAVLAAVLAAVRGRDRLLRGIGAVALLGLLAYLFTPLGAAGAQGAPVAFAINVRFALPALLAAIVLLPLAGGLEAERRQWLLLAALLVLLVLTDRPDAALRAPSRTFSWPLAALLVLAPAALLAHRRRGGGRRALIVGFAALGLAVVLIGYPLQRDYLRDRYRNELASTSVPGMNFDAAYRWARETSGTRIGLAGTTAGFLQYGFYGTDLSNRVVYLGVRGPNGAFNPIPSCGAFRAAVNAAHLDYLVTSPFLNFIHPADPIASPEARWLRGEAALAPIVRSGSVTVWRVRGMLDPGGCGPTNAPLRRVPNAPS